MNGEGGKDKELIDDEDDDDLVDDPDATIVLSEDDEDDDNSTGEINIERLVADLEAANGEDLARRRAARKRLEELRDQLDQDDVFSSTYNFNLDEDLST